MERDDAPASVSEGEAAGIGSVEVVLVIQITARREGGVGDGFGSW